MKKIIEKAKTSCENNGINISDHFADVSKMIETVEVKDGETY